MGPTREELANYFKNNRKYFDELARHYKRSDTEYYDKYIAPFYNVPFASSTEYRRGRPVVAVFAAGIAVLIAGIVMFFLMSQSSIIEDVETDEEEIENEIESDNINSPDSSEILNELSSYDKGIMYLQLGEYDKAEKYLEQVPENSRFYKDARLKLTETKRKKAGQK